MAAGDAKLVPIKNQAYRVTFPILDADGDLVTAAAALDSEVSKDGGTFADCTNEATEIATGSGVYFLDLTAAEMNADTVAIIVKTTTAGAKTTVLVFYPEPRGLRDLLYSAEVMSELAQGIPPATPTVREALMLLYMALRNASKSTATERRILNDAGTVIAKATMSDDGSTFDQGELVSGP